MGGDSGKSGEVAVERLKVFDGKDSETGDNGGFGSVGNGKEDLREGMVFGEEGDGENALGVTEGAVEGEFAKDERIVKCWGTGVWGLKIRGMRMIGVIGEILGSFSIEVTVR
jgi:hypothetical protein